MAKGIKVQKNSLYGEFRGNNSDVIEVNLRNPKRILKLANGKRLKYTALEVTVKIGKKRKLIISEYCRMNEEGIIDHSHFIHPGDFK